MITLLAQVTFAYAIAQTSTTYSAVVEIDGDLPILKGAKGKATLEFELLVSGASARDGRLAATHELTLFKSTLNGAKLPFSVQNVTSYFPKSTTTFMPSGKVVSTDAPKKQLPTALVGLDPQRLPELTYLPIEFPNHVLMDITPWTFERLFNSQKVIYQAKLGLAEKGHMIVDVTFKSSGVSFEDGEFRPVETESGAVYKVESTLQGAGFVEFNQKAGQLVMSDVAATSKSVVTGIVNDYRGERSTTTKLKVRSKSKAPGSPRA